MERESGDVRRETVRRFIAWMAGRRMGPTRIHFNPTYRCNLRCSFCWLRDVGYNYTEREELTNDEVLRLFEDAVSLDVRDWVISGGGEPLCRPVTSSLLRWIMEAKMRGTLITNGTLFTDGLIDSLIEGGWDRVQFSLDAPTGTLHDGLRGRDFAFDKAVGAMRRFAGRKERLGSASPELTVCTVLTNRIHASLVEFVGVLSEMGIQEWILNPYKPYNSSRERFSLDLGELKVFKAEAEEAIALAEEKGIRTNLGDVMGRENAPGTGATPLPGNMGGKATRPACFEPWTTLTVDPDGGAGICCERVNEIPSSLLKTEGLKGVWYGEHLARLRQDISKCMVSEKCRLCSLSQLKMTEEVRHLVDEALIRG